MSKKNYSLYGKNTRTLNLPKYANTLANQQQTTNPNLITTTTTNSLIHSTLIQAHKQNNILFHVKKH
jgi:hypothetical protein